MQSALIAVVCVISHGNFLETFHFTRTSQHEDRAVTPEERIAAKRISRIMRAARKQLGLTQEAVASKLGISQSALSKLEHGSLIPSAPQWFDFCEFTQIATDTLRSGFIERNTPAVVEDGLRKGSFKIPKRYAFHRGSKARSLLPFFAFMEETVGEKKFHDYFKQVKVDADFFIDLDNQINIEFMLDIARYLINEGHLKSDEVSKLTQSVRQPRVHGSLRSGYDVAKDNANRLESLVTNARLYECNFRYRIEAKANSHIDLSITPEPHMEMTSFKNDPVLGDFLGQYKKSYFESFMQYGNDGNPARAVQVIESIEQGKARWLYRIPLNG